MFKTNKSKFALSLFIGLNALQATYAQGLSLEPKATGFVATLEALGLPVLILAIFVGVFIYWFRGSLGFAAAVVIGGVIFGQAPEIAAFILS